MSRLVTSKSVLAPMMRKHYPPLAIQLVVRLAWALAWALVKGVVIIVLAPIYSRIMIMMMTSSSPPCRPCHRRQAAVALVQGLFVELAW